MPAFLPFSIISVRASSISWRTRSEMSRERSLTSSETDSCRFSASLSRIFIAHPSVLAGVPAITSRGAPGDAVHAGPPLPWYRDG